MKKTYIEPEITVVEVNNSEVICDSRVGYDGETYGKDDACSSEYRTSIWN